MYEQKTACLVMIALQLAFSESQNGNVVLITAENSRLQFHLSLYIKTEFHQKYFVITMFRCLSRKSLKSFREKF